jgi:TolA-binding protein
MSYIQRGETERGIERLREFLTRYPGSIYSEVAQFNIGWTYFSAEKYAEAIIELRAVISGYPESQLLPRVLFNLGDAFYNEHSYDSARTYYQALIRQFPSSPLVQDALNGLQYTYEAEGRPAEALGVIEQFMQSGQNSASKGELLMKKGDILFGQGDFGGAILQYKQVMALKPDTTLEAKLLRQLGRSYELENNPAKAAGFYERFLASYGRDESAPQVGLALGQLYIKTKQFEKATVLLGRIEANYPASQTLPEVRYHAGIALLGGGDSRGAAARFSALIQSSPGDVFADRSRLQLAHIHQGRKEYAAALDTLEGIVGRRNDDIAAEALLSIAENYFLQKKIPAALQAFKDLIEQYTEFALLVERARLGAGECYEKLKDRANARKEYEELVRSALDPGTKKTAADRLKRLRR